MTRKHQKLKVRTAGLGQGHVAHLPRLPTASESVYKDACVLVRSRPVALSTASGASDALALFALCTYRLVVRGAAEVLPGLAGAAYGGGAGLECPGRPPGLHMSSSQPGWGWRPGARPLWTTPPTLPLCHCLASQATGKKTHKVNLLEHKRIWSDNSCLAGRGLCTHVLALKGLKSVETRMRSCGQERIFMKQT